MLQSAIANAENNHDLDVDDLVVTEASVGKNLVHEALPSRAPAAAARASRSRSPRSPSWSRRSARKKPAKKPKPEGQGRKKPAQEACRAKTPRQKETA